MFDILINYLSIYLSIRGLKEVRSAYRGLQEVTEGYKGLPGVSGVTRG